MSLEVTKKYLVPNEDIKIELKEGSSKLVSSIKKLIGDVEILQTQKHDTSNLKNSYITYVQDTNANLGVLNERLNALEILMKKLVNRLDELESF